MNHQGRSLPGNKTRQAFNRNLPLIAFAFMFIALVSFLNISPSDQNVDPQVAKASYTDREMHIDVNSLKATEDTNEQEQTSNETLRIEIIGVKDGWIEVIPDIPTTRSNKIATAMGLAVLKGYIAEEEIDKLTIRSMEFIGNMVIIKYYKPTATE